MKFQYLVLCLVLGSGFSSLVSATNAGRSSMAPKPTTAPLTMTTAKPTATPKATTKPTKSMSILNVPPRMPERKQAVPEQIKEQQMPEANPIEMPPALDTKKSEALKTEFKVNDVKPVQVTGFITKNGNIYEIEGKDGIGLIEGRENSGDDKDTHVCNYGSVVIYSDVPCEQVTNVHVGDVQTQTIKRPQPQQPNENAEQEQPAPGQGQINGQDAANTDGEKPLDDGSASNDVNDDDDSDFDDFEENRPQRQQNNNNNRRRNQSNKNNKNKRRRNGNGVQSNSNRNRLTQNKRGNGGNVSNRNQRPSKNQRQRQQQQKRRQQLNRQQQNRRRQQQQQQQQRRRKQNSNGNRQRGGDRYEADDDDDYDV